MDILKKVLVLVAILSVSVFMTGCGGDSADEDASGGAPSQPPGGPPPGAPGGGRPGPG